MACSFKAWISSLELLGYAGNKLSFIIFIRFRALVGSWVLRWRCTDGNTETFLCALVLMVKTIKELGVSGLSHGILPVNFIMLCVIQL